MLRRNWLTWFVAIALVVLGLCLLGAAVLPYNRLKDLADSLMPDHNFNSLKPWNASVFKALFGAGGLAFFGLAALTWFRGWRLIGRYFKQLWRDARIFLAGLRPQKNELGFLAAMLCCTFLAVVFRLERVNSPLHHDEAYTYVAFSRSLFTALTDYSLPNNHVFHTLLVYFSTRLFGMQPWAVRLPAFLAGVLLVPAAYWLAKRLYDRWTALGAAFLVAWFPPLVAYANNARGYTLVALFAVLTLALGDLVRKEKNLFAWALISLLSALGLYTVPVMLLPFGVLFVWLFLENLVEGPGQYRTKLEFIGHWLAAGFGAAFLTLVFYTPILVFSGPSKIFGNVFVVPLPWKDFIELIPFRLAGVWDEWTFRIPPAILLFLIAGWILSLVFHKRISSISVPVQIAAAISVLALLVIERPDFWTKVFISLLPLMLLWAAAGIFGMLQKVRLKFARGMPLAAPVFGLVIIYGLWHAAWLAPQFPVLWAGTGAEEQAALFVQSQLREGDLVVVSPPDDAPVWYYSELHGIPDSRFDRRNTEFERVLVLVDPAEGQTPASVISERGPDSGLLNIESTHLLDTIGKIQIFEVLHK